MKQVYAMIHGAVQGVGFRLFVYHEAQNHHITGWVRNTSNGQVEALLQGEEKNINELLSFCQKGPIGSKVDTIVASEYPGKELFEKFSIL